MSFLKDYILKNFGVDEKLFQEALILNPGSKGYISGAISELLLKEYLEKNRFEVVRITEKPKGGNKAKSSKARGDFYIRPKGSIEDKWLVVESKGLKSNSEFRGGKLENKTKLYQFLKRLALVPKNNNDLIYNKGYMSYSRVKKAWSAKNPGRKFSKFKCSKNHPGPISADLTMLWNSEKELKEWVDNQPLESFSERAYRNVIGPIVILETHLPDGRISPTTNIVQAMPLIYDFNILAIDLFLRTGRHEFVFVASHDISHSPTSPEHLYQNYIIDILVKEKKEKIIIKPPWYKDIKECIVKTNPNPRVIDFSQVDKRNAS
ncbi:MAG: hypothetical protein A3D74_05065 [Candidatus Levybacteria bacterium RIFCSPHIGHO2_02_FULL_37_13]|nr:MAG: hypothetical protein A3D74_05065 [Candidatus Levybacteria bacterium RIFCSPHIGHO2_02_FULL_37_13]OGH30475.1 MAG: hypothetical protein A3E40_04905 [Candidatus Levybacteria bacterium RIFCSPHIGHO2_12_FULL_37_9]OGH40027.1 MAG: hypothetical protein A3B41_03560 [Candidatus Levybacteria bacterium RIFCSPLOWO2_01_FULL_37_26]